MDIVDYLHRLFAYDDWANREVLSSLRTAPNPPPQSLKLTAHILSAEGLWLARLKQQKPALSVWPELALAQCKAEADVLGASWRSYLEECREAGLSRQISYVNSKGESWSSQIDDVLLHVLPTPHIIVARLPAICAPPASLPLIRTSSMPSGRIS